ncbi:MAG TPA: sodium:proton antiporter [Rhodocyclaceae bacterium]|nr:sodium:proton antiporter [Rhodocyclaceae bacterium]
MPFSIWSLIIGALLIVMALSGSLLKRLPVSASMLYLAVGFLLGPSEWGLLRPDPGNYSAVMERVAEVAVLISLFSVGLKLGVPLSSGQWHLPLKLAFSSMAITVALIALVAFFGMGMPLGAAILLGGILAPTDPVLASDVQVEEPGDRDRLRFGLSGEGGLNDGASFPFVMLGLGLLGLHDLGTAGWRWLAVDVLWSLLGGVFIGAALGWLIGKLVVHLRTNYQEAVGLDEFLSLGLVALAYGAAQFAYASGFLAVFSAGLALQRIRSGRRVKDVPHKAPAGLHDKEAHIAVATHPELAGAYLMQAVRGFNEQMERIAELAIVLMVGAMLPYVVPAKETAWFVPLLFLLLRPMSVWVGLRGAEVSHEQRLLISWFGIRGIGSIYYLMFAIHHGLDADLGQKITAVTLTTVAISIVLHGISVTPLMELYVRRRQGRRLSSAMERRRKPR